MLLGLIAAYCAVITSLGLVLATWVSRLGRAVALCVSAYVLFSIGWIVLLFFWPFLMVRMILSWYPWSWGARCTARSSPRWRSRREHFTFLAAVNATAVAFGAFIWIVIHSAVAVLLFLATLATFDHCLGRVSEIGCRSIPFPRKKARDHVDLDLDDWLAETSAEISG